MSEQGRTESQKASELDAIESKLRSEGCSSISEFITKHNDVQANLLKAEVARDKFADNNKKAEVIIGTKGGELGTVKQDLEKSETRASTAEARVSELEKQLEQNGQVITPTTTTTEKPIAEQLAEVEGKLSDEQKALAQALMEAETDDDKARKLVNDPATRLEFLSELLTDPATLQRPKSFFKPEKDEKPASGDVDSTYKRLVAQVKGVTHGPSSSAGSSLVTHKQGQRPQKSVFY